MDVIGTQSHRLVENSAPVKVDAQTRTFKLSDSTVALDGHTLATDGWDLTRARNNLPVLWAHDAETVEHVLGQWENLRVEGDSLLGDAVFMPREVNPTAGMVLDMVDGGWLRMCSVGFVPTDGKPSKRGPGTYDFSKQTLLEASIVPVGSLASALVQARDAGIDISPAREWAKRNLENDMATKPGAEGNEGNAPSDEATTENQPSAHAEQVGRKAPTISKRGLYDVAQLAYALMNLGYITENAEYEAEYEGDESPIPGKLLACLKALGEVLVEMTQEEVAEMIGEETGEGSEMGAYALMMSADGETRSAIIDALRDAALGKAVTITTTRSVKQVRAGKALSRATVDTLKTAHEHMCRAMEHVGGLIDKANDDESIETSPDNEEAEREAKAVRERRMKALLAQVTE